mmetsp:Transcript_1545/g.4840  ORF Transcript_1545/g.4840 Transcript_1545/m.4840 type:complete len:212 (-) Transcript_1545:119-754(-)
MGSGSARKQLQAYQTEQCSMRLWSAVQPCQKGSGSHLGFEPRTQSSQNLRTGQKWKADQTQISSPASQRMSRQNHWRMPQRCSKNHRTHWKSFQTCLRSHQRHCPRRQRHWKRIQRSLRRLQTHCWMLQSYLKRLQSRSRTPQTHCLAIRQRHCLRLQMYARRIQKKWICQMHWTNCQMLLSSQKRLYYPPEPGWKQQQPSLPSLLCPEHW